MKNIIILFILVFLNQNFIYSQSDIKKTTPVKYDLNNYKNIINNKLKEIDVKWIYYKPVIIKIKTNQASIPSPPPNILTFKKDTIEFNQMDFPQIQVLQNNKVFEKIDKNNLEEIFNQRKKEFGIGVVFSTPYKWDNEEELFIDYEIINWDYLCGTGVYNTIEYK
jgi:hypothetical protein